MTTTQTLTPAQAEALQSLCERYNVAYCAQHYTPAFDLPTGWVAGWVGGPTYESRRDATPRTIGLRTIYVGVSPDGDVHS